MAFLHVTKPGSTGFFVFAVDAESPGARIPHDWTRAYSLAPFERATSPKTFAALKARVGAGPLTVVGLWPDPGVTAKWELIVGGETCFFVDKESLLASGTIVHAERSRQLAEQLFGKGSPGAHELLVLLAGLTRLRMPLAAFAAALGRKSRAPFKGFTTVRSEQIQSIEGKFGSVFAFLEAAKAP